MPSVAHKNDCFWQIYSRPSRASGRIEPGKEEEKVRAAAEELRELLAYYGRGRDYVLLGPAPAELGRIDNMFRWKLMIRHSNEEKLIGDGISFCAVCDGAFYGGKTVAVVGGGNSALQEAMLLSELAAKVYVLQNLDFLTGEKMLADQLCARPNVEIITGVTVASLLGDHGLEGVVIRKTADGSLFERKLDGLFVAIGLIPQNEPFANVTELDDRGYARADESCVTATAGIFVAGDCRAKRIRQVATAAADGAVAALAACDYIDAR